VTGRRSYKACRRPNVTVERGKIAAFGPLLDKLAHGLQTTPVLGTIQAYIISLICSFSSSASAVPSREYEAEPPS
jgi:hypothetical protein